MSTKGDSLVQGKLAARQLRRLKMKKIGWKKKIWILLIVAVFVSSGLFALTMYKDRAYFRNPPYDPPPVAVERPDTVVVYYSRTGHTEALARGIARSLGSDVTKIESDVYSRDFSGWRNAANDARNDVVTTPIRPGTFDLSPYEVVFLGSPVWLFRPAPPLWSFVEQNDFTGKRVVLFNTFNSRFKEEEFAKFRELVEKRGGEVIDHVYIKRGRVIWQMSDEELVERSREIGEDRARRWRP